MDISPHDIAAAKSEFGQNFPDGLHDRPGLLTRIPQYRLTRRKIGRDYAGKVGVVVVGNDLAEGRTGCRHGFWLVSADQFDWIGIRE